MRFGHGTTDSGAPRYRHRLRPGSQETVAHGGNRGLLHLGQGFHGNSGQFCQGDVRRHRENLRVFDARFVEGDAAEQDAVSGVRRPFGQESQACGRHAAHGNHLKCVLYLLLVI